MIESTQNKRIKELCKLHQKKYRDQMQLYLVQGDHLIQEAFQAGVLQELYMLQGESCPIDFPYQEASLTVMNKLSTQNSDAKIIGVCKKQTVESTTYQKVIVLDDVQDPGNVGTIIRTAHSFGLDAIFLSKGCADITNPKTIQSSQGAIFHIPCIVCNLEQTLPTLGLPLYATALHHEHKTLQDLCIPSSYALIVGNEGKGVHDSLLQMSDEIIQIEMETFESLNVAIATAICMYTFQYQR